MTMRRSHLAAMGLTLACSVAWAADVNVSVEVGWGGAWRPGQWTPVFVTVTAPERRSAHLDVVAPHDPLFGLRIGLGPIVIDKTPRTYRVLAPLGWDLFQGEVVVRSSPGGPRLASAPLDPLGEDLGLGRRYALRSSGNGALVGVSGRSNPLRGIEGFSGGEADPTATALSNRALEYHGGFVPEERLPESPMGYDALHALVLAAPKLGGAARGRELAIEQWVRAGGRLVIWLADGDVPDDSPLGAILPARVGPHEPLTLKPAALSNFELPERFAEFRQRRLQPKPGARTVALLDSEAAAVVARHGLGRVVLLSIDAASLQFSSKEGAMRFWREVLRSATGLDSGGLDEYTAASRTVQAMASVIQRMVNVRGLGTFDFTYPAIVLLGLMLVVGPIDWFVLKRLGRQPWTWVTTTGWIALITVGAIYIGHVVKSGDLHYRTVRIVDQADGKPVAAVDLAMIYSPRTAGYVLDGPRQAWSEPVSGDYGHWRNRSMVLLPAEQDDAGSRLEQMTINVWNLRCVRLQTIGDAAGSGPLIEAKLRLQDQRIRGSITNRTAHALADVRVHVGDRMAVHGGEGIDGIAAKVSIAPGTTVEVDAPLASGLAGEAEQNVHYYRGEQPPVRALVPSSFDLVADRWARMRRILADSPDMACVLAESEATPAVRLRGHQPKEEHRQVIRALVRLESGR